MNFRSNTTNPIKPSIIVHNTKKKSGFLGSTPKDKPMKIERKYSKELRESEGDKNKRATHP
jgi:hypothetical protein